jgi:hypothetical protein
MKTFLSLVAALAVVASACTTAQPAIDSAPVISQVIEAVDTTAPATTAEPTISVPPGCRLITEVDEYGFDVEVVECGEPTDPLPENPDWLGSDSAVQAATLMRIALIDQPACGSRTSYAELKSRISEALPELREPLAAAVAALERGVAECNRDKDAWISAMNEAIDYLDEFIAVAKSISGDGPSGSDS